MKPLPEKYWENNAGHLEMGVPWITPKSYEYLDKILENPFFKNTCHSLEIGGGGSTIYFAEKMFSHTLIETNLDWLKKIKLEAQNKNISFGSYIVNDLQEIIDILANIEYRSPINKCYDLISIDSDKGYDRCDILMETNCYLSKNGILILDNYSSDSLWPECYKLSANDLLMELGRSETHNCFDFDDPYWHGSGTRLIIPKWLYPR